MSDQNSRIMDLQTRLLNKSEELLKLQAELIKRSKREADNSNLFLANRIMGKAEGIILAMKGYNDVLWPGTSLFGEEAHPSSES